MLNTLSKCGTRCAYHDALYIFWGENTVQCIIFNIYIITELDMFLHVQMKCAMSVSSINLINVKLISNNYHPVHIRYLQQPFNCFKVKYHNIK